MITPPMMVVLVGTSANTNQPIKLAQTSSKN